jgi:CheY-like chemotaxis protein
VALKILLADDSMTAQNMGKKILADAGFDVIPVSNGAAAIKKIASDRPDIIILDVYMPGYTGLEVCERVKGAVESAKTPVLLTVGKMEPFKPEDANRVKADGVMIKPFEATDLIAAVQSIAARLTGSPAPAKKPDASARIPMPPPAPEPHHEDTVRLTPEQVRAFQDATYKDHIEGAAPQVAPFAAPAAVAEAGPSMELPAVPAFSPLDTGAISRALGSHDIFTLERPATASPLVPHLEEPEIALNTSVIYDPQPHPEPEGDTEAQPLFAIESAVVAHEEAKKKTAEDRFAASLPQVLPPPEPAVPELVAESEPVAVRGPSAFPPEAFAPYDENGMPGSVTPVDVATGPDTAGAAHIPSLIDPVLPPLEIVEPTHELEINSPIHRQSEVHAEAVPELVTSGDSAIAEFTTKFGIDGAEEIAVGLMADLSEEQQAALSVPIEDVQPAEQPAEAFAEQSQSVDAGVEAADNPTNVMDEIGSIPATPSVLAPEVVAYVPGYNDTQRIVPAAIFGDDSVRFAAPDEPAAVAENRLNDMLAEPAPSFSGFEPVRAIAAEVVTAAAVNEPTASAVEAFAAAASAGVAIPQVEIAPDFEEPFTAPAVSMDPVVESDFVGDAELSGQLPEPSPEEPLVSEPFEGLIGPAVAAAVEPITQDSHGISDNRLSEAVARAIEHLKPQLISEILKELTK